METKLVSGTFSETFYRLGLEDRETAKVVLEDVKNLLTTPWKPVNILFEEIAKNLIKHTLLKDKSQFQVMQSYAEGLNLSLEEGALSALIPEIISVLSKWVPTLNKGVLGCSSFIGRNAQGEVIHGRLLDFPLHQSFDLNERAVTYKIDNLPVIVGLGATGIPYPSISLMTDYGMTLALHQKFTDIFDPKGMPIFEYIFKLVTECRTEDEVLEFIRRHKTITTWCLNISFASGKVISADIDSHNHYIKEFVVPENGFLYFANELNHPSDNAKNFIPYYFNEFNSQRRSIAEEKISQFFMANEKAPSDLELLEIMTTPIEQDPKATKNFRLDNVHCGTLSAFVLNTNAQKITYLTGEAPKLLSDHVVELNHCFDEIKIKNLKVKKQKIVDPQRQKGQKCLMLAQKAFDKKDSIKVYHQLQMAQEYLEGYPEKLIADFYFYVAQFLFEKNDAILERVLNEFKRLKGELPLNLNDHCLMFILRLEKTLGLISSVELHEIKNENLQKVMLKEAKIPRLIYRNLIKNTMAPRIDLVDIIYLISA